MLATPKRDDASAPPELICRILWSSPGRRAVLPRVLGRDHGASTARSLAVYDDLRLLDDRLPIVLTSALVALPCSGPCQCRRRPPPFLFAARTERRRLSKSFGSHTLRIHNDTLSMFLLSEPSTGKPFRGRARTPSGDRRISTVATRPITTPCSTLFWTCLGFDPGMRRYLFGMVLIGAAGRSELLTVEYLREDGTPPVLSIFQWRRRVEQLFLAFASLVSPLGHRLAFVGGHGGGAADGLYVLDTRTDQIQRVADPPDVPPAANPGHEPRWSCCGGAYTQLEPSIVSLRGRRNVGRDVRHGHGPGGSEGPYDETLLYALASWPRVKE